MYPTYVKYVRNGGHDHLSSEWHHNEKGGCKRRERRIGARRHNENDVTMTIDGLWRYGDWRHVATGCTAVVHLKVLDWNITAWTVDLPLGSAQATDKIKTLTSPAGKRSTDISATVITHLSAAFKSQYRVSRVHTGDIHIHWDTEQIRGQEWTVIPWITDGTG